MLLVKINMNTLLQKNIISFSLQELYKTSMSSLAQNASTESVPRPNKLVHLYSIIINSHDYNLFIDSVQHNNLLRILKLQQFIFHERLLIYIMRLLLPKLYFIKKILVSYVLFNFIFLFFFNTSRHFSTLQREPGFIHW